MIEKFEDLIAWQRARSLTKRVYEITDKGKFSKDFKFSGQIQSAALSVMSNVAEGFERGRLREFYYFLGIAKGSCGEVRSQLYVALDVSYIDQTTFSDLKTETDQLSRIIGALRSSIWKKLQLQSKK